MEVHGKGLQSLRSWRMGPLPRGATVSVLQGKQVVSPARGGHHSSFTGEKPTEVPRWQPQAGKPGPAVPELTHPSVCLSGLPEPRNSTQTEDLCPSVRSEHNTPPCGCNGSGGLTWCLGCGRLPNGTRGTTGPGSEPCEPDIQRG